MHFKLTKAFAITLLMTSLISTVGFAFVEEVSTCGVSLALLAQQGLRPRWSEAAEKLIAAKYSRSAVKVFEGGGGMTKGMVSNIRVEDGDLKFSINGKPYVPFYEIQVEKVETYSTHDSIMAHATTEQRVAVSQLYKAAASQLAVSVNEYGDGDGHIGMVSKIRLEDGKLVFQLDGETYEPFYDITVNLLSTHTHRQGILENIEPDQRANVEELLNAQEAGGVVEVNEPFTGSVRGVVSDVHIVSGDLKFRIDGALQQPTYSFSVKRLETITSPEDILAKVHPSRKQEAEEVLKAATSGKTFRVSDEGTDGFEQGKISKVILADGDLQFTINGKVYKPFYAIHIREIQ